MSAPSMAPSRDAETLGVEAAWSAMWAPGRPPAEAPTESENPLFWCQVRAAVIAAGVLHAD